MRSTFLSCLDIHSTRLGPGLGVILVGLALTSQSGCIVAATSDAGGISSPNTDMAMPVFETQDLATTDAALCSNGLKDGSETDVDCGGSCAPCGTGMACKGPKDCQSALCGNMMCLAPSCTDGVKNGDEGDIDCGGPCPNKCANGQTCARGSDCDSAYCLNGFCAMSQCQDGMLDGMETDVDCGGPMCPPCVVGQRCVAPRDCVGGVCLKTLCRAAKSVIVFTSTDYQVRSAYVAVGDINKDKIPDIVVDTYSNMGNAQYWSYLGVGDGGFKAVQNHYDTGETSSGSMAIADLNRDGKMDIVTARDDLVAVLGNGDGSFKAAQVSDKGIASIYIAVADFDGDAIPDVVASKNNGPLLYIGAGDGTFAAGKATAGVGAAAVSVLAIDIDGDQRMDLISCMGNQVQVALGDGIGGFGNPSWLNGDNYTAYPVAADFDGDKILDIVVANLNTGTFSYFKGLGGGTFAATVNTPVAKGIMSTVAGDFNGDGKMDLAFESTGNNVRDVSVLAGKGNGKFAAATVFPGAGGSWQQQIDQTMKAADFNKDGYTDLVVPKLGTSVTVMLNISQ